MNILFLVDSISYGGAGRVVSMISNKLFCKGYQVTILLLGARMQNHLNDYHIDNGVDVIYYEDIKSKEETHWYNYVKYIRFLLKEKKINICVAFLTVYAEYAIVASLFSKTKVIACERNDPHNSPTEKVYRIIRKPLYCLANAVICQTHDMKSFFPKTIQKKTKIIFNPVNENLPIPVTGKRSNRIVMVGKLTEQKNYGMAIEAFEIISNKYDNISVEIYGEGILRERIQKQINSLGLAERITLMGHMDNIFEHIKDARLFIMTSYYEGMSNALIEAMAMGIPCISTDHPVGGAREIITDGINGMLVPIDDKYELARAMDKVLSDDNLSRQMSLRALEIRNRLSVDSIVEMWEEVFSEC